jgi:hypothetical protein
MSIGQAKRAGLEIKIKTQGQAVIVYNHWNTESQTQFDARALKGKTNFRFLEQLDIQRGSVIQIKNSRDYWLVKDTEDKVMDDVLYEFEVLVEKIDEQGLQTRPLSQQASAVFHGDITGAVQIGGSQNTQTVNIQINTQFDNAFNKVLELLQKDTNLDEYQKEDAIDALQKLPELAKKEPSESVMKRAKEKLYVVNSSISTGKELAAIAAPYLLELAKYFHIS